MEFPIVCVEFRAAISLSWRFEDTLSPLSWHPGSWVCGKGQKQLGLPLTRVRVKLSSLKSPPAEQSPVGLHAQECRLGVLSFQVTILPDPGLQTVRPWVRSNHQTR